MSMLVGAIFTCLAATAVDGDTLKCADLDTNVRIHALHAQEMRDAGGPEAKAALTFLVAVGPVECTVVGHDRYRRHVAGCRNGLGWDLARTMIVVGEGRHCPAYGRDDLAGLPEDKTHPLPGYCQ